MTFGPCTQELCEYTTFKNHLEKIHPKGDIKKICGLKETDVSLSQTSEVRREVKVYSTNYSIYLKYLALSIVCILICSGITYKYLAHNHIQGEVNKAQKSGSNSKSDLMHSRSCSEDEEEQRLLGPSMQ